VKQYESFLALFLNHLSHHTASLAEKKPDELYKPEEYILSLGGKRLRPLLALIACDLFNKDASCALDSALAVELFHNFSLIHDDILDAAPLRRGKATVHKVWNTNIAILSGDVMLVKATQVLEKYDAKEFKQLCNIFHRTAIEVCEGQQMDMNFENIESVTVEEYLEMIGKKTAVLLGCSLQMGAINAGADVMNQNHLCDFGKHLGIAFQLLDDLLDAFAEDAEKFGKQPGGDIIANKKTFLLLKALELCSPEQKKELHQITALENSKEKVDKMLQLFRILNIKKHCESAADEHTQLAIQSLEQIQGDEQKKESLKIFALELLKRQI